MQHVCLKKKTKTKHTHPSPISFAGPVMKCIQAAFFLMVSKGQLYGGKIKSIKSIFLSMHLILRIPTKDLIFCFSLAFSQLCLHENLWVILYVLEKRKTNWKCKYFDEQLNKNRLVWHTDSTGWGLGNRSWLINYGLYLTRLKRFGKKSKNGN